MKRLGILGGSFNPIHYGHLLMAQTAKEALGLEKVFFVPVAQSPFKTKQPLLDSRHRMAMLKLSMVDNKDFIIYDGEVKRGGVSYTVDTLEELKRIYPQTQLYLIMGWDSFEQFGKWKNPAMIAAMAQLVVINRPGYDQVKKGKFKAKFIDMPALGISATDIRTRVKAKQSIAYLTSPSVIRYISNHHLYQ